MVKKVVFWMIATIVTVWFVCSMANTFSHDIDYDYPEWNLIGIKLQNVYSPAQ